MRNTRKLVSLLLGVVLCILAVTPFAMVINRFDWGVGLLLVAPPFVWLLLRAGRALERWANNEGRSPPTDPDFPDDPS